MTGWYQMAGDIGGGAGEAAASPAQNILQWATSQSPQQWADIFTGGAVSEAEQRIEAAEQAAQQARTLLTVMVALGVVSSGLLLYLVLRPR